jgi:hypothetical protein
MYIRTYYKKQRTKEDAALKKGVAFFSFPIEILMVKYTNEGGKDNVLYGALSKIQTGSI